MARLFIAIGGLLVLGALFASLSAWQLARAATSRTTLAQFEQSAAAAASTALPRSLAEGERFERIAVRGEYAPEPQFLLDNMLHNGLPGYHVLTALEVDGVAERVLVNRGWVPAGSSRRVLPEVAVDAGERIVTGRVERLPQPGLRLGADDDSGPSAAAAIVLQYPTAATLARRLGEPVLDYQLLLDPAAPDGYVRDWQAPVLRPERHLAYAGQWGLLAVGAVATALVLAYRTMRRKT